MAGNLKRYLTVCEEIRRERGEFCEACGVPSRHMHHVIPVSETRIHSELVYEPANILILCDDCHALMHPLIRNISEWGIARKDRGRRLNR
jgi:5-methylcytosine-specific restriction endonuclease McrA